MQISILFSNSKHAARGIKKEENFFPFPESDTRKLSRSQSFSCKFLPLLAEGKRLLNPGHVKSGSKKREGKES